MGQSRVIEYTFFFLSLGAVAYFTWLLFAPFLTAIALASISVIICYPLHRFILRRVTRGRVGLAAFLSTLIVFSAIITPVSLVSAILVQEFVSFYQSLDGTNQLPLDEALAGIENQIRVYIPDFEINLADQLRQSLGWLAGNLGAIFAGTVSVIGTFLIAMLASFYLFKDGPRLLSWLISLSPLKNSEETVIFERITRSVRSVVTGTVLVAILQGALATLGFVIFGIEQAVLWGTIGALAAILPGFGTLGIMIPAVIYLLFTNAFGAAVGLTIWAICMLVIVDNFVAPYLMSRGNSLHPFIVLMSVIGGISLFGPLGFIIGPVLVSLFLVLLEIYGQYLNDEATQLPHRKKKTS